MKAYAKQIGAEYVFERDSTFFKDITSEPVAFNSFKPVFDELSERGLLFVDDGSSKGSAKRITRIAAL